MALNWNEIRDRAINFSKEWQSASKEEQDSKPFLIDFFNVFGISRKRVATFEYKVKKLDDKDGYIDLIWKGTILVEMKSRGKSLDRAYSQAIEYTYGLQQHELPKYILVSNFERFRLYDLEENTQVEFKLNELYNNINNFTYLLGFQKRIYQEQDPANIKAAELMGKLHDRLKDIGYTGHPLEVYLVRVLFCLFSEDTGIFNKYQFQDYIENRTNEDGSDLAGKLQELFQVLNTQNYKRFKNLDEELADFPYINGKLFEEILPTASFDSKMRNALLECCYLDWSKISPSIFGSMFQSVMNPIERRNLGAHYTSETNILKVIKPLFLDELWDEFEKIKANKNKLPEFHKKVASLKFLDPACGCGNFLVITYRELRKLELEILREQYKTNQGFLNISDIIWIDVDKFYGIEIEEFPVRIAEVAMWLIDHQMNMLVGSEFGQYFARLPLRKSATIIHGNALQLDWTTLKNANSITVYADELNFKVIKEPSNFYGTLNVITKKSNIIDLSENFPPPSPSKTIKFDYIFGNPPFVGAMWLNHNQRQDVKEVLIDIKRAGVLDYVTCWYIKAAKLIQNSTTKVAFVSTNSITQGEQVGILWKVLLNKFKIKIHFAHRTFKWSNEGKGNAAVHCVIIGFANYDTNKKVIFEYIDVKGEPQKIKVNNINPYLLNGNDVIIETRSTPISNVPKMTWGSQPRDGGHLILSEEEYFKVIKHNPDLKQFIKLYLGGREFINNQRRYCFWLKNFEPSDIRKHKIIMERIDLVRKYRLKSNATSTRKLANIPYLFAQIAELDSDYLAIPEVSSEKRKYIPIGYLGKDVIASNKIQMIPNASLYLFGILTSEMHMTWMRYTCGRLESRFSYSNSLVYNNFPFPLNPNDNQIKLIEEKAQYVLDTRLQFPNSSLADLYDTLSMPKELTNAHNELDKAVDLAYSSQIFKSEANRMEFLFELYEKYITNSKSIFEVEKITKKGKKKI